MFDDQWWPPLDYPALTSPTPTVTGATRDSTVNGLSTFTAAVVGLSDSYESYYEGGLLPLAAVTTRDVRLIFVNGQGGVLRWSLAAAPLAEVGLDITQQVFFLDDAGAQVRRWTGPTRHIEAGVVVSARLPVPRLATRMQLRVLSLCDTNSGQWTERDAVLEQVPAADPYVPPGRDEMFGEVSPEGVPAPAPPAGLPGFEANSPARRSPQVRWCQEHDSVRPDLVGKRNARGS